MITPPTPTKPAGRKDLTAENKKTQTTKEPKVTTPNQKNAKQIMSKSLGELKVTYGSKQSYIQRKIDNVWRLLIGVSETQCADHARMSDALLPEAQKPKASKDALVKKRASLIAA